MNFEMPFLELLPRLSEQEYAELRADIQKRGAEVAVVAWRGEEAHE